MQKDFSNICTVISPQTFLGDGGVVADLAFQDFPYVLHIHCIGKINDIFYIQDRMVCLGFFFLGTDILLENRLPVFLHQNDIGVMVYDMYPGDAICTRSSQVDLKYTA